MTSSDLCSLPDEVLDHLAYTSWGLTASEVVLLVQVSLVTRDLVTS